MAAIGVVRELLEQSDAKGTRSSSLRPQQWTLATLIAGLLGSVWLEAPEWVTVLFAGGFGLYTLLGAGAYLYFMFKNPDQLRSESFTLHKMAIEKGLVGDHVLGLGKPKDDVLELLTPPAKSPDNAGEEKS